MTRYFIAVAALILVVMISATIWMSLRNPDLPSSTSENVAPRQYDTTSGQEMRPRWSNSKEQSR